LLSVLMVIAVCVCCSCREHWWSTWGHYCEWCQSLANCCATTMVHQVT